MILPHPGTLDLHRSILGRELAYATVVGRSCHRNIFQINRVEDTLIFHSFVDAGYVTFKAGCDSFHRGIHSERGCWEGVNEYTQPCAADIYVHGTLLYGLNRSATNSEFVPKG
jgi:hypothetical protein